MTEVWTRQMFQIPGILSHITRSQPGRAKTHTSDGNTSSERRRRNYFKMISAPSNETRSLSQEMVYVIRMMLVGVCAWWRYENTPSDLSFLREINTGSCIYISLNGIKNVCSVEIIHL